MPIPIFIHSVIKLQPPMPDQIMHHFGVCPDILGGHKEEVGMPHPTGTGLKIQPLVNNYPKLSNLNIPYYNLST